VAFHTATPAVSGAGFAWGCVVVSVSVVVPLIVPVIVTVFGDNAHVGANVTAVLPLNATVQASVTVPVNPPLGATVMVLVFPVAAPADIDNAVGEALTAYEGGTAVDTIVSTAEEEGAYVLSPR
jgi:hypothetical protein